MSQPHSQTPEQIVKYISSGNFQLLLGLVENLQFDAKSQPYFQPNKPPQDKDRYELAKDVSAFANASGGVIAIGCKTEKSSDSNAEIVTEIRPFERTLINIEQYTMTLHQWVVPKVNGLVIQWHASAADPRKGLVTITIPEFAAQHGPYLVSKVPPSDSDKVSTLFAYHVRAFAHTEGPSAEFLQAKLQLGMQLSVFAEKLLSIENRLEQLSAGTANQAVIEDRTIDGKEIRTRIEKAKITAEWNSLPAIVLAAYSSPIVEFRNLSKSQDDPVVQALDKPKITRPDGFFIGGRLPSSLRSGRLRQSYSPQNHIVELWKDGVFLAIGRGDDAFLAWGKNMQPNGGIPINSRALVETTLNFALQAQAIFQYAAPPPTNLHLHLMLTDMMPAGVPPTLSNVRETAFSQIMFPPRSVKRSDFESDTEASFKDFDPAHVAFLLLSDIFAFFGYSSDEMPYLDQSRSRIQS